MALQIGEHSPPWPDRSAADGQRAGPSPRSCRRDGCPRRRPSRAPPGAAMISIAIAVEDRRRAASAALTAGGDQPLAIGGELHAVDHAAQRPAGLRPAARTPAPAPCRGWSGWRGSIGPKRSPALWPRRQGTSKARIMQLDGSRRHRPAGRPLRRPAGDHAEGVELYAPICRGCNCRCRAQSQQTRGRRRSAQLQVRPPSVFVDRLAHEVVAQNAARIGRARRAGLRRRARRRSRPPSPGRRR